MNAIDFNQFRMCVQMAEYISKIKIGVNGIQCLINHSHQFEIFRLVNGPSKMRYILLVFKIDNLKSIRSIGDKGGDVLNFTRIDSFFPCLLQRAVGKNLRIESIGQCSGRSLRVIS